MRFPNLRPRLDFRLPSWPYLSIAGAFVGLADVIASSVTTTFPSFSGRLQHALFDIATAALLGLVADFLVALLSRLPRKWHAYLGVILFGTLFLNWVMERIFVRQADVPLEGKVSLLLRLAFALGTGLGTAVLMVVGTSVGAARHRWAPLAVVPAFVALFFNFRLYRDDYVEAHSLTSFYVLVLLGSFLSGKVLRAYPAPRLRPRLVWASLILVLGLWPPSNSVRQLLFKSPGSVGAWIAANVFWTLPQTGAPIHPDVDPRWLSVREGTRAPSEARPTKEPPVVVLLTIDATRRDAILGEGRAAELKNFSKLMKEGAVFTQARSPGSQTAVSLSALFTGKYFSELRWEKFGKGRTRFDYPATDDTERFVAKLTDFGVSTFKVVSLTFLRNDFGVARGFAEEEIVTEGRRHARGKEVVDPLIRRLRNAAPDEPLFVYAHLTEPHAPYDRGKVKAGLPKKCYLSEVNLADDFVGQVMTVLSSGDLARRSVLIISADHGEAFGEHGTYEHTKTIYEEQLRVPLFVWGAGIPARWIDEPVSLVDLGPTVLDLFKVPTPDFMVGESLLPLLINGEARLTRPLFAEGRLRRAIFIGDLKVIVDERRKTVEAYDLAKDPDELVNIFDSESERVQTALATLNLYFENRMERRDGYTPIYKP
jgi:hypothetical protein